MANYVFVAMSLDGFIATRDGSTDWLNIPNPDKTDYGYKEFTQKVDALLMGRLTFETAIKRKPYPYHKHVFVLSNTIKSIPINLQDSVEVVNGDIKNILEDIHNRGFQNLYIDGGLTIQSFLGRNLIDEMTICTLPIILGSGLHLFGEINTTIKFEHIKTTTYDNGVITNIYKKSGGN